MSTLLIKNASFVATMDKNENELRNVSIFCENGVIKKVGDCKNICLLYTSPSPRDTERSRMPSSA